MPPFSTADGATFYSIRLGCASHKVEQFRLPWQIRWGLIGTCIFYTACNRHSNVTVTLQAVSIILKIDTFCCNDFVKFICAYILIYLAKKSACCILVVIYCALTQKKKLFIIVWSITVGIISFVSLYSM